MKTFKYEKIFNKISKNRREYKMTVTFWDIMKLILAIVIGYALIFFFIWLFGGKKKKENKDKK